MMRELSARPRELARAAGVLYVLEGLTSVFGGLLIPGRLVVPGDAAATAASILSNESLYVLAITSSLVSVALHTALTVFLYYLFRPAGRMLAVMFACIGLMAVVLQAVAAVLQFPALLLLTAGQSGGGLGVEESQALAKVSLQFRAEAFNLYLGFFGFRCAVLGALGLRSTFMPRLLGALLLLTGLGYLTFLSPPLAGAVAPFNMAVVAPGELGLVAWLLIARVDGERWRQRSDGSLPG